MMNPGWMNAALKDHCRHGVPVMHISGQMKLDCDLCDEARLREAYADGAAAERERISRAMEAKGFLLSEFYPEEEQ